LSVDISTPGRYQALTAAEVELPAGTAVKSWLVHFDPPQGDAAPAVTASMTFPNPVVGLLLRDAALAGSDAVVGLEAVTYPAQGFRGLELKDIEQVWLSDDQRSLRVLLSLPAGNSTIDQLRIL